MIKMIAAIVAGAGFIVLWAGLQMMDSQVFVVGAILLVAGTGGLVVLLKGGEEGEN